MATQPVLLPGTAQRRKADHNLTSVWRYVLLGILTIFGLIGGVGGWAATTDLSGAVQATGTVVVAGSVKKIQHPSGGVVGQIFVTNGDRVKAGDVLVRLDETVTRASLQLITKQADELQGRRARLIAERDESDAIAFSQELSSRASEPDVAQMISGETTLFQSRRRTRAEQKAQLAERIAGLEEEIAGNTIQAEAKTREIVLIARELDGLRPLEAQGLVTTSKMMSLKREAARLEGEKAQLQAAAGTSRGKVAEIEIQRLTVDSEAKSDVVKDLREAEGKLVELTERRTAAADQLSRVDIKSPVNGLVHQISVFTVGGVITTTEPLMLIVPEGDTLVIDAKIAPSDIDQARSHHEATIRFPAFNQRTTPSVSGRVTTIAADLTTDPKTGLSYYVARVEISDDGMSKLSELKLVPGMPAEVQITTSARTALSYLVKPLSDQFAKAFKER